MLTFHGFVYIDAAPAQNMGATGTPGPDMEGVGMGPGAGPCVRVEYWPYERSPGGMCNSAAGPRGPGGPYLIYAGHG